jgi:predicted lipopolysaccharide heptosyltransferase III
LSARDLRSTEFSRILLIKLSALGDVIHTIPVLNKLRRRYPSARIDWLVTPAIGELLRHHPAITNVIAFARDEWAVPWRLAPFASFLRLAKTLRETAYDLVLDIHGQFRTAALTVSTGAAVRIGFDRPRSEVWNASPRQFGEQARKHAWQGAREGSWLAYTHHIRVPTLDLHAVDRYLNVAPMLGLDDDPADFSFPVPQAARSRVEALLTQHAVRDHRLITIAPGTVWETKKWGNDKFAKVADHFLRKGFAVLLIGSPRERILCEEVARLAPGAVNVAGATTVSELAALIQRSTLSITNDSGPMHLAVALNRPVVSIFGPTDPLWIGPYRRANAVLQSGVSCAPCYLRRLGQCHRGHSCMTGVSPGAVIDRAERFLARPDAQPAAAAAAAG